MLIGTVDQALVDFGEDHDDLVLLDVWDELVVDHGLIELLQR